MLENTIIVTIVIMGMLSLINLLLSTKIIRFLKKCHSFEEAQQREQIHVPDQQLEALLREEKLKRLLLNLYTIRNAVHKQTTNIHVKSLEDAFIKSQFTKEYLSTFIPNEKVITTLQFSQLFHSYLETYWRNKKGGFKTVFTGDIDGKLGEVGQMMIASEQLVTKLDKLIKDIEEN